MALSGPGSAKAPPWAVVFSFWFPGLQESKGAHEDK